MKIDFNFVLKNVLDDSPILDGEEPVKVRKLFKQAVLADTNPDGSPIAASEKVPRFDLYLKLYAADDDADYTSDELQLLDKAILVYGTIIAGQLHYLLSSLSPNKGK